MPPRTISPSARRKLEQSRRKFLNKQPQQNKNDNSTQTKNRSSQQDTDQSISSAQQQQSSRTIRNRSNLSNNQASSSSSSPNDINSTTQPNDQSSQKPSNRLSTNNNNSKKKLKNPKNRSFNQQRSFTTLGTSNARDPRFKKDQSSLPPRDLSCLSSKQNRNQFSKHSNASSSQSQNNSSKQKLDQSIQDLSQLHKYLEKVLVRVSTTDQNNTHETTKSEWAFIDDTDISDFHQKVPDPAVLYPFELDDFQKRAIVHVESQSNVFVAAHTSAGKTVVAEYAIALSNQNNQKVIYTSPIKTLSNQKFRDFRNKFDDVGLVTGDVSINDNAKCVIMTTEILRSMLYKGADMIQDVAYVIFDEVQFFNDEERGVVWEESIIMLPPNIGIIMLSATVPNALEFAAWVGKTKSRRVAVVSTDKRPVPLEHSILFKGENTNGKLTSATLLRQGGAFDGNAYSAVFNSIKDQRADEKKEKSKGKNNSKGKGKSSTDGDGDEAPLPDTDAQSSSTNNDSEEVRDKSNSKSTASTSKGETSAQLMRTFNAEVTGENGPNSKHSPWLPVLNYLVENEQIPSVIFCFSKKKCESAVAGLEHCDLLPNAKDKNFVHQFFRDSIKRLRDEDKNLPQLIRMEENLKRGISAHHAGLLPIVKEITEILFSKGLVKLLFATETFAMGVNMPARTVVFGGIRKNDGKRFRDLEAGEYTQMSGRAGRRGIDKVGHVYLYFPPDEKMVEERFLRKVMTGKPITLQSAFRLTYNMILNVLLADELRVEEMINGSFLSVGKDRTKEALTAALSKADQTLETLVGSESKKTTPDRLAHLKPPKQNITNTIDKYMENYCKLMAAESRVPVWEKCAFLRDVISVGSVIVAELSPGRLAIGAVFSIVGDKEKIRKGSKVWVAFATGLKVPIPGMYPRSALLLPHKFHEVSDIGQNTVIPQLTSMTGLIISLCEIDALDILFVSKKRQTLTDQEISNQTRATKQLHFGGSKSFVRHELVRSLSFLHHILTEWKNSGTKANNFLGMSEIPRQNNYRQIQEQSGLDHFILSMEYAKMGGYEDIHLYKLLEKKYIERKIMKTVDSLKSRQEFDEDGALLPEYQSRVNVLEELGYIEAETNTVQLKGRYACHVSTANCVVLTQIIVESVLHGLRPAEVASLLSSLVCRKKNCKDIIQKRSERFSDVHVNAITRMQEVVGHVGEVQEKAGVSLAFEIGDADGGYVDSVCRWDLVEAVYLWAEGSPFCDITEVTEQQEGDIVVCIKRLNELLRDAQKVADGIGNKELFDVLEEAITAIRRDVIFNGSLYFEDEPTPGNV